MKIDLISRRDAMDIVEKNAFSAGGEWVFFRRIMAQLAGHPTVDAVPVVRCQKCKHFNWHERKCENDRIVTDNEGGASYRLKFNYDDYCSFGELNIDEGAVE